MGLPSGKNRFFIYDLQKDSIVHFAVVAHGNCRSGFLKDPLFSNVPAVRLENIKLDMRMKDNSAKLLSCMGWIAAIQMHLKE